MCGYEDRLTGLVPGALENLESKPARELTFNELLAVAGKRIAQKQEQAKPFHSHTPPPQRQAQEVIDMGRDLSLAHTALEDALMRYNSASYRIGGTWKRVDPDAASEIPGDPGEIEHS